METDNNFSIIIPAAGIGKRMKSYGPKALIRIGNAGLNVLGRQLNILQQEYPKNDIVIVAGFEDYKIKDFINSWKQERVVGSKDIKVVTNKHYNTTNVAKSIAMATEFCDQDNYLVVYGDLVFNRDTFRDIRWNLSGVLLDTKNQMNELEAGVVFTEDGWIDRFCYDSETKWAQIAYLTKNDMSLFLDYTDSENRSRFFTFEIFNLMLQKMALKPYYNDKMKIVELDYSENIQIARQMVREEQ